MDPDVNYGPANFIRTHVFVLAGSAELPFGKGRRYLTDASGATDAILGGWQLNADATIMSGLPVQRELPGLRPGPRHRPRPSRTSSATRRPAAATD